MCFFIKKLKQICDVDDQDQCYLGHPYLITYLNLSKLQTHSFLSDDFINLFLEVVSVNYPECLFFNKCFWSDLNNNRHPNHIFNERNRLLFSYPVVKNKHFFHDFNHVFIPMNIENKHFVLFHVDLINKQFHVYDSLDWYDKYQYQARQMISFFTSFDNELKRELIRHKKLQQPNDSNDCCVWVIVFLLNILIHQNYKRTSVHDVTLYGRLFVFSVVKFMATYKQQHVWYDDWLTRKLVNVDKGSVLFPSLYCPFCDCLRKKFSNEKSLQTHINKYHHGINSVNNSTSSSTNNGFRRCFVCSIKFPLDKFVAHFNMPIHLFCKVDSIFLALVAFLFFIVYFCNKL